MSRPKVRLSGFTLIEVLIAVGAVSLIAIGLAKVFSSTGETVRAGRRLSNLNEYASLIERQLRDDVSKMTRDGFLVIRNRVVADGTSVRNVLLDPEQQGAYARPRRVDELAFFASGRFSTLRDPIHPSRHPTGTAARIYYGHGLRNQDSADTPELDMHAADSAVQAPFGEPDSANEFAADWILLRHITTLIDPGATDQSAIANTLSGVTTGELADNKVQVGLQPAAASIFRNLALAGPAIVPSDAQLVRDGEANRFPQFSSGIIDLAATNLPEIRNVILDAQPYSPSSQLWDPARDSGVDGANPYAFQRDGNPTALNGITSNMKAWMIGALPAGWPNPLSTRPDRRIRAELAPPNLLGTLNGGAPWPDNQPWRRTDQMMLAASNFVPHCTEFIVEWSFGIVEADAGDPGFGEVKWYGLERRIDPANIASDLVAAPYTATDPTETFIQRIPMRNGQVLVRSVNPALVHFPPIANPPEYAPFYSCFGYLDPTYPDPGLETDSQQRFPSTIPWAWPKLLRITISLVDPTDRLREQTYQFIIEIPEAKQDRF
jgi:type II secretory pathway pseudopilin PulG